MPAHGQRIMERLGRGFVAVGGGTGTLLSWRLYGTEQGTDVAFNVYMGTTKLNATPITNSTNYQDTASGTDYTLKAIVGGVEETTGTKAMSLPNGYLEIPLKAAPGRTVKFGCVGDLDGDGEYEYVVDRLQRNASQYVDAYHRDGRFLWRIDMGPNSTNTDLSSPGAGTIAYGHSDNEAVYDIDSDGKGELILKVANGTIFGDGKVLNESTNPNDAWITAIDGMTGAEKGTRIIVPNDLASIGNITGHFGIAYFDGVHPTFMFKGKVGGTKGMMDMAFDFKDNAWSMRWKFVDDPISSYTNNHQIRCLDINGDGLDEFVNGGYARDGTGKILWNLTPQKIVHGDRWHIGRFNPTGDMIGWGIGQNATYDWYEYDAKDGTILRKYGAGGKDLARGDCGDVDPTHLGYECWTDGKVFSMVDLTGSQIGSSGPPQNFRIWWDGDVLSEQLDGGTISKWAYPGMPSGGFSKVTLPGIFADGNRPPLYGDMFGDWREELMMEQSGGATLRIYTTAIATEKRLYTLMHNPEYRNAMVEKGYTQSRFVDYYLGEGMTDPPKPNMTYPGAGSGGSGGGGTTGSAGTGGSGGTMGAAGAGGVVATGGRGATSTGDSPAVGSGGAGTTGGGPEIGGALATGGSPVAATGGTIAAAGTSAVVSAPAGSTGEATGGGTGGASGTIGAHGAADAGCSCAIGAASGRDPAGYLVAMLGMLCLVLKRRRRRANPQD
jgi:rhamnogalacturonan endolyase